MNSQVKKMLGQVTKRRVAHLYDRLPREYTDETVKKNHPYQRNVILAQATLPLFRLCV